MANYCDYEVKVRGSKKAGLMVFASMPCLDYKDYGSEEKTGDTYLISFKGNCKWSVNFDVIDQVPEIDLDSMSENDITECGYDYWDYSLCAKSEALKCEIMVHYWSEESGFDQFDYYKNGEVIKKRKIAYDYEEQNEFDWEKTEFVGHEGEYDESVDGEQQDENLMSMLRGLAGAGASSSPETNEEDEEEDSTPMTMIFVSTDVLNEINHMDLEKTGYKMMDYIIEITDLPYYIHSDYSENKLRLRFFNRNSVIMKHDLTGTSLTDITLDRESGEAEGSVSPFAQVVSENLGFFISATDRMNLYIQKNGLEDTINSVDKEHEGILLYKSGDDIRSKVVKGKQRPELMASGLFMTGGEMCRPYPDESDDNMFASLFGFDDEYIDVEELTELSEAGDTDAMIKLANFYNNGDDDNEPDYEKAFELYKKLSEEYDIGTQQYNLGTYYLKGCGTERDFEKAVYWFRRAAENGDSDAEGLAELFGILLDSEKKAKAGDAEAQSDYAQKLALISSRCDLEGLLDEAFSWAEKSAEQDYPSGIFTLAQCYANGRGCEKDMGKAIELYEKAAEMNEVHALNNLANAYFNGEYVEQDDKKAFELFLRSAELGNGSAMRNVGRCYQFGNGVEDDMDKAVEWYEKALEFFPDDEEFQKKTAMFRLSQDKENGVISNEEYMRKTQEIVLGVSLDDDIDFGEEEEDEKDDVADDRSDIPSEMDAMYGIMGYAMNNNGVSEDRGIISGGVEFTEQMAEKGDPEAMFVTARYYFSCGRDSDGSRWGKAIEYIKKARDKGHTDAAAFIKKNEELFLKPSNESESANIPEQLEDIFLGRKERASGKAVCAVISGYNSSIDVFIKRYLAEAKNNGTVIKRNIPNPDTSQIDEYISAFGNEFELTNSFIETKMRKMLSDMNGVARSRVSDAIITLLSEMKANGKTDSMLKNTFVKYICWIRHCFSGTVLKLGNAILPKILFIGTPSYYEEELIKILCNVGADAVIICEKGSTLPDDDRYVIITGDESIPEDYFDKMM